VTEPDGTAHVGMINSKAANNAFLHKLIEGEKCVCQKMVRTYVLKIRYLKSGTRKTGPYS
jgi:hypothetical protein